MFDRGSGCSFTEYQNSFSLPTVSSHSWVWIKDNNKNNKNQRSILWYVCCVLLDVLFNWISNESAKVIGKENNVNIWWENKFQTLKKSTKMEGKKTEKNGKWMLNTSSMYTVHRTVYDGIDNYLNSTCSQLLFG